MGYDEIDYADIDYLDDDDTEEWRSFIAQLSEGDLKNLKRILDLS